MSKECNDTIDFHTIINDKDVYLCEGEDHAFSDAEGLKPILCEMCKRQKQGYTRNDSSDYELVCWNCYNEEDNEEEEEEEF